MPDLSPTTRPTMDLLRLITCGNVDDGKSTLLGRLLHDTKSIFEDQWEAVQQASVRRGDPATNLALLTDGLRAERERGITIDVAYRYFATPRRKFILADCPGHFEYTRNMVTGASSAQLALLLVDVRNGLTEQTCRHAFLASLLRIKHLIVCVNKMDLVDFRQDAFEHVRNQFMAYAERLEGLDIQFIPIAALTGDNVVEKSARLSWFDGPPLLYTLETVYVGNEINHVDARFPVQLVRRVPVHGGEQIRQYLGRVESGHIKAGDEIAVMPAGRVTRVRAVSDFHGPLERGESGRSIAIEVQDELDIARGDVLTPPLLPPRVDDEFTATICWFSDDGFNGQGRYLVKCGTRTVAGRVAEIIYRLDVATLATEPNPETLRCNDIARVRLALAESLAFDAYDANRATGAFILIDADTNATVAAGMIALRDGEATAAGGSGFDVGL